MAVLILNPDRSDLAVPATAASGRASKPATHDSGRASTSVRYRDGGNLIEAHDLSDALLTLTRTPGTRHPRTAAHGGLISRGDSPVVLRGQRQEFLMHPSPAATGQLDAGDGRRASPQPGWKVSPGPLRAIELSSGVSHSHHRTARHPL
jgi:hypothetical protein